MMTKIQVFAKAQFDIELTAAQMEYIAIVAAGGSDKTVLQFARRSGLNTANKVIYAYLQDSLKAPEMPKPVTNKHGQPIGDYPKDIPTQAEFDKAHATPLEYGDEEDWLVVSKQIDQQAAFDMIVATMTEWGVDAEYLPKDASDLGAYNIGWGYDHDSYHYSEGGYWICSDENQVSKRYEAWGWATQ